MNRKHLFIVASIIWGIPGIIIFCSCCLLHDVPPYRRQQVKLKAGMQNRFQFRSLILTFVTSLSIMRTASVSLSVERTGTAIMFP